MKKVIIASVVSFLILFCGPTVAGVAILTSINPGVDSSLIVAKKMARAEYMLSISIPHILLGVK